MGHKMELDGQAYDFTPQNSVVNLFRKRPDFDYTTYHTGEHLIAMFNPLLAHWLGGIALNSEDQTDLRSSEREHGNYAELYGGNPRVIIDDDPNENEIDMRVKAIYGDLDNDLWELFNGES